MSRIKVVLFCSLILLAPDAFSCSCDMLNPSPEDTAFINFPNFDKGIDLTFFLIFYTIWHISLAIFRGRFPRMVNSILSWLGPITLIPTAYISYIAQYSVMMICPCSIEYIYLEPNYLYLTLSILFILFLDRYIYVRHVKRVDQPTAYIVDK